MIRIVNIIKKKDFEDARSGKSDKVPMIMPEGHIELHPKDMIMTDKKNCVTCKGELFHTDLRCSCLRSEMQSGEPLRCISIKDAKAKKMTYCADCSRVQYLIDHGRADEV
jgi:hypothetical protein